jgi:hypothetical protein
VRGDAICSFIDSLLKLFPNILVGLISVFPVLFVLSLHSPPFLLLVLLPHLGVLGFGLLSVLPDKLIGVFSESLVHGLSEHSLHFFSLTALELSSPPLVLLLAVQIIHKLFSIAFVVPSLLSLIPSVLGALLLVIRAALLP